MLEIQSFRNNVKLKLIVWAVCFGLGINVLAGLVSFNLKKYEIKASATMKFSANSNKLYDQINALIDQYLDTKNSIFLAQADKLADQVLIKNQDYYPIDLVHYYKSSNKKNLDSLRSLRQRASLLRSNFNTLDSEVRAKEIDDLARDFSIIGAEIEAKNVFILKAKDLVIAGNFSQARALIDLGIKESDNKKHLFLKCHYLLWLYKTDFSSYNSINNYKALISLAKQLGLPNLEASANMSLAGLLEIKGELEQSKSLCEELLKNEKTLSLTLKISIKQIFTIVKIRQGFTVEATELIENVLITSRGSGDHYNAGLALLLKAIVAEEIKDFESAKLLLIEAKAELKQSPKGSFTDQLNTLVIGKLAQINLEEKNIDTAKQLYLEALRLFETTHPINNYILNWLYCGLSNSSTDPNEIAKYKSQANSYLQMATLNNDQPYSPIFKFSGE